ncbi:MAG: bifunctional glycosyltransferase/CDP-glycerol:glycerophosphate glycerophosphotransferase [Gaiellaceae bacterium]
MSGPRLSVLLAVSGERPFLRECVSSVLAQSFRDVEVIAVVDGDGVPPVQDARLVVRQLEEPVDEGEALNLALETAAGDYVWFTAPTDRLPPGALAAVAARLDELEPDVLAVEEARSWAPGAERSQPLRRLARNAPPGETFTLADRPAAAELGLEVRGRIFRRAFLRGHGFRFAPGQLPLTLPALPAAERIAVLPRVSYVRLDPLDVAAEGPPAGPRARRRSSGILGRVRRLGRAVRRAALQAYYRVQLRAPLDPDLAVFAAYWYRGYACNPRAIAEKLGELVPRVRRVWVVAPEHAAAMPPGVDHVIAGTRAYYRLLARATYLVNNVNFPNELVKRKGTIHLQTHHGTPVKTMGLDLGDAFVAGRRLDFDRLLRRTARWDYSVSANAFTTKAWERAYPGSYESLEVGYPRNDALVNATEADAERIRAELGIEPGRRAVLYAPTHREYLRRYVPTADVARLAGELGPDSVIMVRVHYFYEDDPELEEHARAGRVLDVSAHPSVEELCLAADALVTDYSSLLFDYAVLDRPIVVHAPDWDAYRTLRGTYFDLLAEPPGVATRSDDELVDAFRSGAVAGEHAARLRGAFRARFCALEDGRASERVVRRVWLGEAVQPGSAEHAAPPEVKVEA